MSTYLVQHDHLAIRLTRDELTDYIVHNNAPALEAALADLAEQSVDQIVHWGDAFNGPVDPAAVAMPLRSRPMIHVW